MGAVKVAPYLGYFIQVSASTNLKIYNTDGTTTNYNNPIDTTNFNGRCGTGYNSAFYQFGQPAAGFDTKIIYFNAGEWVDIQPPAEIIDRGIFHAFTDELDGTIWIVTSLNEVFFTSDGFITVQKINGLSVDYNKDISMSFNQSHAMIVGTGICKVIDKQTLTYLDLVGVAPTVHGGVLLDDEWLIASFNRIYSSTNQFDTYNEAYVNGRNFEKSIKTIHEHNGNIYLEEQDNDVGVVVIKAELDIDLTKPKEKIRVFKESF